MTRSEVIARGLDPDAAGPEIAFMLYDRFTALDIIGPYEMLRWVPGAEVKFVAKERGPVTADSGSLSLVADHAFEEVPAPDILVVPGVDPGAVHDERVLGWIRSAHQTSRWTTSVCAGSLLLGAAGLLDGLRATGHWGTRDMLEGFGATFVPDERYVREGKIITAAGVSAGIDMGLYLVGEIAGAEEAQAVQLMAEYDPAPPFDAGSLAKAPRGVVELAYVRMRAMHDEPPLDGGAQPRG